MGRGWGGWRLCPRVRGHLPQEPKHALVPDCEDQRKRMPDRLNSMAKVTRQELRLCV